MNVSQQTLAASASDPKIGALELQKIHQQLHYQCKWASHLPSLSPSMGLSNLTCEL